MTPVRSSILVACTLALFGCKRDETTGKTTITGASGLTGPSYVTPTARIAAARCNRDVACGQVGATKRFETRETCAREEGKKTQDELQGYACTYGVDEKRLEICIEAIAKEECTALLSSLQHIDACSTAALCAPAPP